MDSSEWEEYKLDEKTKKVESKPKHYDDEDADLPDKKKDNNIRKMDIYLDGILSRVTGTYEKSTDKLGELRPKVRSKVRRVASASAKAYRKAEEKGDEVTQRMFQRNVSDSTITATIRYPKQIIILILVITVLISFFGIAPANMGGADFREKIHGEFDVYLPQDHETKRILEEINEDFSTNLIIVLVQTNNSLDVNDPAFGYGDILDRNILLELDYVERAIDPDMEDDGEVDGVKYVLSISVVIKVANSTPPRFQEAVHDEIEDEIGISITFRPVDGDYSIPDQSTIDRLIDQMPEESLKALIRDTNEDGIYDTAAIIIGLTSTTDQELLVENLNSIVKGANKCDMTVTGPIPMTIRMTERTYEEFLKVLPAAIILVGSVLILFHRNFKIILITGLPVICSLGITYGFLGLAVEILTPQVVLIAPILIALGVAYGLYIANRYADEKDIEDREERIKKAVKTTGRAVFLSAATTSIGFSSLIFMEMIPLRVMGIGLSFGIMVCYLITIFIVPSLIIILNYEKKSEVKSKERIGNFPVRNRKKIVVVAISITIVSFGFIGAGMVTANMDFIKMAPQDEDVIIKMREYSDIFGGGQPGMILIKGTPTKGRDVSENTGSMRDKEVLMSIDTLETIINGPDEYPDEEGIENTNALGIVDVMKMIKVPPIDLSGILPFQLQEVEELIENAINKSFWDVINSDMLNDNQKQRLINIFYDSLPFELRGVFVNKEYSRSMLLIEMPAMDVVATQKAVEEVNTATNEYPAGSTTTHLTGFAAILVAVNDMLVVSSVTSTLLALVLVFIILAIIFRSIKYSSLTLIPVSLVVAWQPILLVFIGGLGGFINPMDPFFTGDLNLFSAIIGSIIVGIGIDFGVHMTERIRERGETVESVKHSVATSGMSFVEATATTIAGLSAVFLILIPAIQEFIILVILLLICSVLGALLILPAIYTIIFRHKNAKLQMQEEELEEDYEEVDEPEEEINRRPVSNISEMKSKESDLYGPEPD